MFCSSYQSHNDPRCFLINKNDSVPHLFRSAKQNGSINGSSEAKTTKISLRKLHQSCLKLSLNKSLKRIDEKMVTLPDSNIKIQRSVRYICNPQKIAYFGFSNRRSQPQINKIAIDKTKQDMSRQQVQRVQKIVIPSMKDISNPLQTLRMHKYYSDQASNLKKTRKQIHFGKQFASKPLKQSIVSLKSKYNDKQKLQQSLIIVDYFHPSQLKLQQLSPFIQQLQLQNTEEH